MTTVDEAKAEIKRIRQMLKEYQAKSEASQFANKLAIAVDGSELSHKAFEVAMKVQELLVERGHSASDVKLVFDAFDKDGSGSLDWVEVRER